MRKIIVILGLFAVLSSSLFTAIPLGAEELNLSESTSNVLDVPISNDVEENLYDQAVIDNFNIDGVDFNSITQDVTDEVINDAQPQIGTQLFGGKITLVIKAVRAVVNHMPDNIRNQLVPAMNKAIAAIQNADRITCDRIESILDSTIGKIPKIGAPVVDSMMVIIRGIGV